MYKGGGDITEKKKYIPIRVSNGGLELGDTVLAAPAHYHYTCGSEGRC